MLNIYLGNACNFNCSYCLQPKSPGVEKKPDLDRMAAFIRNRSIEEVRFWGGEPLLYFSRIQEIIAGFEQRNIHVSMAMVTNGSLLNKEGAAYLNEKNIFTCLSFHEEMDPSCLPFLAALKYRSINYLITGRSLYLWDAINLKLGFERQFLRPIHVLPIYVNATATCPSGYYLTPRDIDYHIRHLRLLHGVGLGEGVVTTLRGQWDNRASQYIPGDARCMNPGHVSVDVTGRVLPCHYADNINDVPESSEYIPGHGLIPSTQRHVNSQECRACEVLPYCQGGCHLSQTHATDCLLARKLYDFLYREIAH